MLSTVRCHGPWQEPGAFELLQGPMRMLNTCRVRMKPERVSVPQTHSKNMNTYDMCGLECKGGQNTFMEKYQICRHMPALKEIHTQKKYKMGSCYPFTVYSFKDSS